MVIKKYLSKEQKQTQCKQNSTIELIGIVVEPNCINLWHRQLNSTQLNRELRTQVSDTSKSAS